MKISIYISFLFALSEVILLLSKRSKSDTVKNRGDKRSLLLLWVVIPVFLGIGMFIPLYHIWQVIDLPVMAGIVVAIIGFIIRWTAIVQLGKLFTVDVSIANRHTLKSSGLYKRVRHPSYSGLLLIIAGIAFCLNNLFSLVVILVPVFLAINYRIRIEEKILMEEFGEQYANYKKRVASIIPWIY